MDDKDLSRALGLADECKRLRAMGDAVNAERVLRDLYDYYGFFVDGKLRLPAPVEAVIGA